VKVCPHPFAARPRSTVHLYRRIGLQTVKGRTARQRQSWAVAPCCSSTALARWSGRTTHGCTSLRRAMVEDWAYVHATTELCSGGACQTDAGPVPARIGSAVLPWDGPAHARGASTRRSEDRFYEVWRDASWRELCGVKLSAHAGGPGRLSGRQGNQKGAPALQRGPLHSVY